MNNNQENKDNLNRRDGSTDITYKGSVVVKYVNKKTGKQKVVKKYNSGKLGLFKFILYCLASDPKHPSQTTYFPVSLMCYSTTLDDADAADYGSDNKCLTNTQPYKGTPYIELLQDPSNPKITYCFDIPNNNIIKSNNSIRRLVLVNQKYNSNAESNPEDSICAEIELDADESIQTDINENIVIYWTLSFSNKTSE